MMYSTGEDTTVITNEAQYASGTNVLHFSPIHYGKFLNGKKNEFSNVALYNANGIMKIDYPSVIIGMPNVSNINADYSATRIKGGTMRLGTDQNHIALNTFGDGSRPSFRMYKAWGESNNDAFDIQSREIDGYNKWQFTSRGSQLVFATGNWIQSDHSGGIMCIGAVSSDNGAVTMGKHIRIDGENIQAYNKTGEPGILRLNMFGGSILTNAIEVRNGVTVHGNMNVDGELKAPNFSSNGNMSTGNLLVATHNTDGVDSVRIVNGSIYLTPRSNAVKEIYQGIPHSWLQCAEGVLHIDAKNAVLCGLGELKEDGSGYKYNGNVTLMGSRINIGNWPADGTKPTIAQCNSQLQLYKGISLTGAYYGKRHKPYGSSGAIYLTPENTNYASRIYIGVNSADDIWRPSSNINDLYTASGEDLCITLKGFEPGSLVYVEIYAYYMPRWARDMDFYFGENGHVAALGRYYHEAKESSSSKIKRVVFRSLVYVLHNYSDGTGDGLKLISPDSYSHIVQ